MPCIQKEKICRVRAWPFDILPVTYQSPAENAGKIAGAFKSGMQSNFQDRKRAAGKKICGLGYAVLVDIGNRRCVKVRFEETTKILWIHIEYSSKI